MTEAYTTDMRETWATDSRLRKVCQRPLCRLHANGTHASVLFRRALKMFSHDELSDSMTHAPVNDANGVHGLTVAPLTKEEIDYPEEDSVAYMVQYVENNIIEIKNDPTQLERPECSRTTETHIAALGRAFTSPAISSRPSTRSITRSLTARATHRIRTPTPT